MISLDWVGGRDLGLTLTQRNKGRVRAASLSSACSTADIFRSRPKAVCVRGCVCQTVQAHNALCTLLPMTENEVSVSMYCLIACHLGLFIGKFYCASVEADSMKERPVALVLELL